jgi:hypothetical protein
VPGRLHDGWPQRLLGGGLVVRPAGTAKVGRGGGAAERERDHVVELHLPRRSTYAARVERILAAVTVAEAHLALDG